MAGPDLSRLSPTRPVEILGHPGGHAGTVSGMFEAVDRPEVAGIEARAFGLPATVIPYDRFELEEVARISFEFERPWRMLVSGRQGGVWHTVVHDFKTSETARIRRADGRGVYKASIDGDRMAYAERLSEAFEAREIRFAFADDSWTLEPLESGASDPAKLSAAAARLTIVKERDRCLRANCAVGRFCSVCRNHKNTRADLETLGLVDRDGHGCPRGLAWDAPPAALAAIRPGAAQPPPVWCERFMVGTTPAFCQQCVAVRQGGDPDTAGRWLQRMAGRRQKMACAARVKTASRRTQECCGREEHEVAVYHCAVRDAEAEPEDCRACRARTPPVAEPAGGAEAC
jgi:hypothetical protein